MASQGCRRLVSGALPDYSAIVAKYTGKVAPGLLDPLLSPPKFGDTGFVEWAANVLLGPPNNANAADMQTFEAKCVAANKLDDQSVAIPASAVGKNVTIQNLTYVSGRPTGPFVSVYDVAVYGGFLTSISKAYAVCGSGCDRALLDARVYQILLYGTGDVVTDRLAHLLEVLTSIEASTHQVVSPLDASLGPLVQSYVSQFAAGKRSCVLMYPSIRVACEYVLNQSPVGLSGNGTIYISFFIFLVATVDVQRATFLHELAHELVTMMPSPDRSDCGIDAVHERGFANVKTWLVGRARSLGYQVADDGYNCKF